MRGRVAIRIIVFCQTVRRETPTTKEYRWAIIHGKISNNIECMPQRHGFTGVNRDRVNQHGLDVVPIRFDDSKLMSINGEVEGGVARD